MYKSIKTRLTLSLTFSLTLLYPLIGIAEPTVLRDPTQPPPGWDKKILANGNTGTLAVNSILSSAKRKLVIIDGQLLSEGERIGEYTVLSINADHVILQQNERQVIRYLIDRKARDFKQPTSSVDQKC